MKKYTEALAVAIKATGLEVKADNTNYTVLSRNHKAEQSHNIQIDNSSFEKMEEFKYFGTNVSNENSIEDEIRAH